MVYLFKDGLARFASEEYNTEANNIDNNCIHLTNSAVNKVTFVDKTLHFPIKSFQDNVDSYGKKSRDDPFSGYLWTLKHLKQYLEINENIKWSQIWEKLITVVR